MVHSKSGKSYTVEQASFAKCSTCTPGDPLQPTCTKEGCQFLCRHMYNCEPLATISKMDTCVNMCTVCMPYMPYQMHKPLPKRALDLAAHNCRVMMNQM